jgi:hypothetical protein
MQLMVLFRRWLCTALAVMAACGAAFGAATDSGAAFSFHCAGSAQLAGNTNLTALHNLLGLKQTPDFEAAALRKIAASMADGLGLGTNAATISLLAPLLGDVAKSESLGSFNGNGEGSMSFIVAVRVEAGRTAIWQENLGKALGAGGEAFTNGEFSGRRWSTRGSNSLWMIAAKEWLLVGRGNDFSNAQAGYLDQIKKNGRPVPSLKGNWFEADAKSDRVGGWLRLLKPAQLRIDITTNGSDLQINARALETGPTAWKPGPWQIPKELLRGQIISFTAARDPGAFLNPGHSLTHLAFNPLTNQFYCWALGQMPLLNYMAWPVAGNASNALETIGTQAPAALNPELERFNGMELVWHPDRHKLALQNVRLFTPVLEPVRAGEGQFLLLSSFPWVSNDIPAPDALMAQVEGRPDLVYYDWELTGRRLAEWILLNRMIANRNGAETPDGEVLQAVENTWLTAVAPLVGNTVTEIMQTASNELTLTRKAPIGVTAVEMVLVADWLCDAGSGSICSTPPAAKMPSPPGWP